MELSAHQRPLNRQEILTGDVFVAGVTGCGHIMVTAAAIAAASSSVGTGEMVATFIA